MTNRTDDFNRTNNDTSLGTPSDNGSAWVANSGTWGVISNKAYKQLTDATHQVATLESSISDCDVQGTMTLPAGVAGGAGIVGRLADDNNYILTNWDGIGTTLTLWKKVSGSFTSLGTYTSGALASGDVMKLRCSGSSLTVFQNGVSRITATDGAGSTNTKHGIHSFGGFATGSGFDDAVKLDDFSITALSAGSSAALSGSASTGGSGTQAPGISVGL